MLGPSKYIFPRFGLNLTIAWEQIFGLGRPAGQRAAAAGAFKKADPLGPKRLSSRESKRPCSSFGTFSKLGPAVRVPRAALGLPTMLARETRTNVQALHGPLHRGGRNLFQDRRPGDGGPLMSVAVTRDFRCAIKKRCENFGLSRYIVRFLSKKITTVLFTRQLTSRTILAQKSSSEKSEPVLVAVLENLCQSGDFFHSSRHPALKVCLTDTADINYDQKWLR